MATVRLSKDFNTFCGLLDERAFGHLKARYWFSPHRKCTLRKSARLGPAIRVGAVSRRPIAQPPAL